MVLNVLCYFFLLGSLYVGTFVSAQYYPSDMIIYSLYPKIFVNSAAQKSKLESR